MSDNAIQVLPLDQFNQTLQRLLGLPNGAHVAPVVVQDIDFYGKETQFIVQTVKSDQGETVFLTVVNANGADRIVIPARVIQTIDRQRATVQTKVRRRHGRRLAEERKLRGEKPAFLKK